MSVESSPSPNPSSRSVCAPSSSLTDNHFCIGLDAGGSKTDLLACTPEKRTEIALEGPSANPQRIGRKQAVLVLAELVQRALADHPSARIAALCAGIAGAGSPNDQQIMAEHLQHALADFAPERVSIVHDAAIALEAAFAGGSGVIVIAGTGSVAFARTKTGSLERAGGWGYLLGDEGSGHVIGIRGLQAVAHAIDGGPATLLQTLLADRYDIDSRDALIHRVYQDEWPVQQMAPLVIEAAEQNDDVARRILEQQTDQLAVQVEWLVAGCDAVESRLAMLGGLVHETHYRATLRRALHRHLSSSWTIKPLEQAPVTGALRLACHMVS